MTEIQNAQNVKLFALNSNQPLAEKVSKEIGIPLSKCTVSHFADGEISVVVDESVRGKEVYVLQSVSDPVNTNLMELLIMVDALRRASAQTINVVMPYYGYARQDRKARSREPITAKLVADLLEDDKVDRLITIDLHAPQVQGFFDIPVDHLRAALTFEHYLIAHHLDENAVVVAPDHAGVSLARLFAEHLDCGPIAIVDKRDSSPRANPKSPIPEFLIGDVKGKTAIIVDDIVDTGYRIYNSARLLQRQGADKIYAVATHPVLSKGAVQWINDAPIEKMLVTDSIVIPPEKQSPKIVELTVSDLIKEAIARVHNHQSLQTLFH